MIWIALALICLAVALMAAYFAGKENIELTMVISIVFFGLGILTFFYASGDLFRGFAQNQCELGTYQVAMIDDSDQKKLYIAVRNYQDYALRLCSIDKKNAHFKKLATKNVRLTFDGYNRHLYPSE